MKSIHTIDEARLGIMLNDLRLPTIKTLWPQFAEQADREGWPAARFLSAIAEHELAERSHRRIERHLAEAHLPPGKTLDSFAFDAVPMVSRAQVANRMPSSDPSGGMRMSVTTTSGMASSVAFWSDGRASQYAMQADGTGGHARSSLEIQCPARRKRSGIASTNGYMPKYGAASSMTRRTEGRVTSRSKYCCRLCCGLANGTNVLA